MRKDRAVGSSTLSALEFDQNPASAKRAAAGGPVFIMDRGEPSHVLMTIDDFHKLVRSGASIVDLLSADQHDGITFEGKRASGELFRPAILETQQRPLQGGGSSTE